MKTKLYKTYKIKSLINGNKITGLDPEKIYVAVPDRGYKNCRIKVQFRSYNDQYMLIDNWHKAILFRRFHDQYRPDSFYTLGYFEWQPNE